MPEKRFHAFKVSTDGTQSRRDYVSGLTLQEARDETRFPLGTQHDAQGSFVWSYALDFQHSR